MTVSWIVPTVDGREDSFARSLQYAEARSDTEIIVVRNAATCGKAWADGMSAAVGDYVYFAADDIEPHDGFIETMIEAVDAGYHPAATVLMPDGSKQSCGGIGGDVCRGDCADWQFIEWSPTPFIRTDWWQHLEPHAEMLAGLHYSTDRLVSFLLEQHGIPSVMRRPALLTHYNEPAGRLWTAGDDNVTFESYARGLLCA